MEVMSHFVYRAEINEVVRNTMAKVDSRLQAVERDGSRLSSRDRERSDRSDRDHFEHHRRVRVH